LSRFGPRRRPNAKNSCAVFASRFGAHLGDDINENLAYPAIWDT
jgi:hypothetical protein